MPEYVFAIRNCRPKWSTKAIGNPDKKPASDNVVYVYYKGVWNAAAKNSVVNQLKSIGGLKDPESKLDKAVNDAANAKGAVKKETSIYQERVGKTVVQLGFGYHLSNAQSAKSGMVWLDLD